MNFIKQYITALALRVRGTIKTSLGQYSSLKIALISDSLTQLSLEAECQVRCVTPSNYDFVFNAWGPDLLLVESAWQGYRESWKYQIASYPTHPERTNYSLVRVLTAARDAGIPTVFWNKEDNVHYERFIDSAKFFEYIFTVDSNCVDLYKRDVPSAKLVDTLMFPVQSRFHYPCTNMIGQLGFSCFVGSYGTHVHPKRRQWQDLLFRAFAPVGLDIYDRNSARKAKHYRYPVLPGMRIRSKVSYPMTARLYRGYKFNLNVNTIESSPTKYSRRLIEILASGGVAISTPSLAASRLFSEYCHIVGSAEELAEVTGWSSGQYGKALERARAGAEVIHSEHSWENRLRQIESLGIF